MVGRGSPTLTLPPWWGREVPPWPSPLGGEGEPTLTTAAFSGAPLVGGQRLRRPVPHQRQKPGDLFGTGHHEVAMSEEVGRGLS